MEASEWSRRKFLKRTFAFSAAAVLSGCKRGASPAIADTVTSDGVHILAVGDWGEWGLGGDCRNQASVAAAMRTYVQNHHLQASALLMLGDNFYGPLEGGVHSPRWQSRFEAMYPASTFACPAYAVPGNHDYQRDPSGVSKVEAELAYAQAQQGTRWKMLGLPYSFSLPEENPVITFIAYDSNMPNEPAQPIPKPDFHCYTLTDAQRQAQVTRLSDMLAAPPLGLPATPFTAMMGHHPLYSDGPHGDNQTLIRDIDPLLRKRGVHLYLGGHDHDLQHIEMSGHPTSFVLSGGGGAKLYELKDKRHAGYAEMVHGFSHIQVKRDMMIVRHLGGDGCLLHKFTKTPDGKVSIVA